MPLKEYVNFLSYLKSLPELSKLVLLVGVTGMAAGMTGSRWATDPSWVKFFDNLHWTSGIVASATFAWLSLATQAPERVRAFRWFALGLTAYAIGELLWGAQILVGYSGFPGPADVFYLLTGPCLSYGLLLEFYRLAKPEQRIPAMLDSATFVVATITIVLAIYLPHRGETALLPLIVLIAYPVTLLTAICIALVMTVVLGLRLSWQWLTFVLSIFAMGLFWAIWNLWAFDSVAEDGTWFNIAWSMFHLSLGLGIVSWQAELEPHPKYRRLYDAILRVIPLLTVVMACLAILLVDQLEGVPLVVHHTVQLLAPLVILLAMARQVVTLSERERLIAAQAALAWEEERFRTLTHATTQMVWTTDSRGEVHQDIPSWRAYTGQSLEDVKGRGWVAALHPDDVEGTVSVWAQAVASGSIYDIEYRVRRHDGVYRHFKVRGVPVRDADGKIREWVGTCTDITELKQNEELLWRQANYDPLTGLPNRRMFRNSLEGEMKKSDRSGRPLAMLMVDLDQFKEINDTLGHELGDSLLQEAAQRIRKCVREVDVVARLGGDEFTVILTELSDVRQPDVVVQKIIDRMAAPFHLGAEVGFVTASIGITFYPNDTSDIGNMFKNADQAMYAAKSKGRNCFSYFTRDLEESAINRMRLSNDLRRALSAEQFMIYFQPIVELFSGHISKAEALLRWKHPTQGMISPMEFIPLAESNGLIHEIGDWVFRQSADWISRWHSSGHKEFQISINVSPVQFNSDTNSPKTWSEHLQMRGLSGHSVVIEITEGLLLNAESRVMNALLAFEDAGIEVAIDDFGTGYSALSYLKKFHIDYLKIDMSFIRNMEKDPDDVALCEAIIVMAHKLGLKVIAEGVETAGQRNLLQSMGCDYGQGYLFARPMPGDEFVKFLELGKSL